MNVSTAVPTVSQCKAPVEVRGAYMTLTPPGDRGQQVADVGVTYGCYQNYKHTGGNLTRACLPDGTWNGTAPVCAYAGHIISAEVLIAVTGSLAVLVLLLLPVEFLRHKLKQAHGRQILKKAKRVRNNDRIIRQPPFMGTPPYSQRDKILLVPGKTSSISSEMPSPQTNYTSKSNTLPHILPKLDRAGLGERDTKKKTKRKKRKCSLAGSVSRATKSGSALTGRENPLHVGDESAETDDVITRGCSDDVTARDFESQALQNLSRSRSESSYLREADRQGGGVSYDNDVSLNDERLQQNVFSLGNHKLPSLTSTETQSSPNILHDSSQ